PTPVVLAAGTSNTAAATNVNTGISQGLGYSSSVAGNVITIWANNNAQITALTAPFTTTYYGQFTAPAAGGHPLKVTHVLVNGTNVLSGAPYYFQPNATAAQVATALASHISGATVSGAVVTVPNGNTPVTTLAVDANNTYGTLTGVAPANNLPAFVSSIT